MKNDTQNTWTRRGMLALPLALCRGLTYAKEPEPRRAEYNHFSDEEEAELGKAFATEFEKQILLLEDAATRKFAEMLVERVAEHCRRNELTYTVKVINTDEVNALAIPGGFVYLNRGLLSWVRDEAELAAVVSHEVSHVVGRHGANTVARMAMARALFNELKRALKIDRSIVGRILEMLGGPVKIVANLKYSRNDETEADLLGLYNMQRSGWEPEGMLRLMDHFVEGGDGLHRAVQILTTHPAPSNRAARIRRELSEMHQASLGGRGAVLGGLPEVQARLSALAPAPPPKSGKAE